MVEHWTNIAPTKPGWYWLLSTIGGLEVGEFMFFKGVMRINLKDGKGAVTASELARRGYHFWPTTPPGLVLP